MESYSPCMSSHMHSGVPRRNPQKQREDMQMLTCAIISYAQIMSKRPFWRSMTAQLACALGGNMTCDTRGRCWVRLIFHISPTTITLEKQGCCCSVIHFWQRFLFYVQFYQNCGNYVRWPFGLLLVPPQTPPACEICLCFHLAEPRLRPEKWNYIQVSSVDENKKMETKEKCSN